MPDQDHDRFGPQATFDLAQCWDSDRCAGEAGLRSEGSWRSMVHRRYAPASVGYHPQTGRRVWCPEQVRRCLASRAGQGSRTDLKRRAARAHIRSLPDGADLAGSGEKAS